MDIGIFAEVVAALATAAAALFAGYQVWELRLDRRLERQLETNGVSLSWRSIESPTPDESPAMWKVEFTLTNPGRMPISDVRCDVRLAHAVRRHRHDGSMEAPTTTFVLRSDVLPGGGERSWVRRVESSAGSVPLDDCSAVVSFRRADGQRHRNVWPLSARAEPEKRLE